MMTLMSITKTSGIKNFCDKQHLKYIAHVTRMENNSLQKQFLFCEASKGSANRWKKLSELTSLDESQLRRVMANRLEFLQVLSTVYEDKDSKGNLMRTSVSSREKWWWWWCNKILWNFNEKLKILGWIMVLDVKNSWFCYNFIVGRSPLLWIEID